MKVHYCIIAACVLVSCNAGPASVNETFADPNKVNQLYQFRLNPPDNASFRYAITNTSEITMEVNGQQTNSSNHAEAIIGYIVHKDSANNFLFNIRYEKITIKTKKGAIESEADADNAALSINPVERMLGIIKQAPITAIVGPDAVVKDIRGYKELGDELTKRFAPNDIHSQNTARSQWEKLIGGSIFKGSIDNLFTILPGSNVKPGDSWTAASQQAGEIPVNIKSTLTLKKIDADIATIESEGDIVSIQQTTGEMIKGDIKGIQSGHLELDLKTGMLITSSTKTEMKGTIQTMGVTVPVKVSNKVEIRQL